jgi:dipeptidyl aminopeptidase/acylaminoacyl peptidase
MNRPTARAAGSTGCAALAIALLVATLPAQQQAAPAVYPPNPNLVVDNIPPVPLSVAEKAQRYREFRSASLQGWHPERREILVSTRFANTNQIHHIAMPLGARTQVTFSPERVLGASFQPRQGRYFVFSHDVGGGEWFQLSRFDMQTGDITLLTDGRSRNSGPAWSNDGSRFAYSSTRRTGRDADIHVMNPADPGSNRLLVELRGGGWGVTDWSPDDRTMLLGEYVSANESHVWLLDATTGEKRQLTRRDGDPVAHDGGFFSADGRGFYATTDAGNDFHRLAYFDLATMTPRYLTSGIPWDVDAISMSDDRRSIAFIVNEAGVGKLYLLSTATGQYRPLAVPVGIVSGLRWHPNNRDLGFNLSSARSPADIYSMDVTTGELTRWTQSETGGLNTASFSEPELVRWKSFDGLEITGFLYHPPASFTGKRPVIVNIHGGPEGQSRPGFIGPDNYFLNELGVAIIYPNIRGSTGYGKTFLAADNGMKREDSYRDIEALLDWIRTQPQLDADRIMITGGSYGGHMTLAIATRYNDRICCSKAVVAMSNLVTFLENTEAYRRDLRRVEYGDERDPEMRAYLTRIAPMTHAANIRKPMYIVQGRNDPRVPHTEAEQLVATLKANGTPAWYLLGLNEGHGFSRRENQDFDFYTTIMFVQRYLLGRGVAAR